MVLVLEKDEEEDGAEQEILKKRGKRIGGR